MKKEKLLYFEKMNKWDENDQNHFSDEILNIFYTFFFQLPLPPLISAIIFFPFNFNSFLGYAVSGCFSLLLVFLLAFVLVRYERLEVARRQTA